MRFSFQEFTTFNKAPVFVVKADGVAVGSVSRDEETKVWAATLPDSEIIEPKEFKTRADAANHLARAAGLM